MKKMFNQSVKQVASHAGVFRELVFLPSPQTPAQRKTTFLSHCFICVVGDQSTIVQLSVDRLNTTERDLRVTVFLLFFPSLRLSSVRSILNFD